MKNICIPVAAVLIFATTGCTTQKAPAATEPVSRVSGAAYLAGGPSPGVKIPMAHASLTFSRSGKVITRVSTDGAGNYAAALAPGTYQVRSSQSCLGIKDIAVLSKPAVTVDLVCAIP